MNIKKVCADGTRILSDFEEINKLLEDGWIVIEYGGISIKSGDGGIEYIPQLFAFRLKKKDSSNVIKQNWKEIIKDDYLKMTFDEIIENQENISSVFSTIHKSEADRKMNEGWTILDERKIHKSSSATKYTLIF